jgi:ketosteroid isomerase-like protein
MSAENVQAFRRGLDAINAQDVEGMLEVLDPDVEWHDVFNIMLGGSATVHHGHDGVRALFEDLFGAFAETHSEYTEVRDLGERTLATGTLRAVGNGSGAVIESPVALIGLWSDGKAIEVRTFLDHDDALEAAGLAE